MTVDGLVVVDKPEGWTSHDVVARCRRIFGQKRVGHAGTLDPGATGVLLVGLGRATRLMRFLTELPKTYTCELVLGVTTDTLDADGTVTGTWDMEDVGVEQVRAAAAALTGPIMQVPPMVSAVQVGGRRLHELARAGIEIERAARPVTVYRFEVTRADTWRMEVTCSSGTYVRVLVADVGSALGGGAHLRDLRRTAIGSFTVADALGLEAIEADPAAAVRTPRQALADYPSVVVTPEVAALVAHGRKLSTEQLGAGGDGPWAVTDDADHLLAVYEAGERDGPLRPAVVLVDEGHR